MVGYVTDATFLSTNMILSGHRLTSVSKRFLQNQKYLA